MTHNRRSIAALRREAAKRKAIRGNCVPHAALDAYNHPTAAEERRRRIAAARFDHDALRQRVPLQLALPIGGSA